MFDNNFPSISTEEHWMPKGEDPFVHDSGNSGVVIGNNVVVMMGNQYDEDCRCLYVVDARNGHRIKISFHA